MSDFVTQLAAALGDRYRIERELGGGGMSRVFVAHDESLDRDVVVKVLLPELAATLSAERFAREIRLVAALQEPHIVPVLVAGTTADGLPYYTMPFVAGDTLRARLLAGALPLGESLSILRNVAQALAYAHERGLVHRHIKPENVLLSSGTAVVTDFGIAKALAASSERVSGGTLTSLGTSIGTPAYMAPEQAAGDPATDHRADLYAFGVVAYELVAGKHPFAHHTTPHALIAAHMTEAPAALASRGANIPANLDALVMQCLAKDPRDRPASARDVLRLLDQTSPGTAAMTVTRKPGWTGRYRIGTAIAVVMVGAAVLWGQRRSRGARDGGTQSANDPNRIAILYLEDRTPDKSLGFLADGLTEGLIAELSSVNPLKVISGNGVRPFQNTHATPDSIGRALRVGTLVSGTVAQSGNVVRVNLSFIDAATGQQLGNKILERPRTDLFALQDDLVREASSVLRVTLGRRVDALRGVRGTRIVPAWEALERSKQTAAGVDSLLAAGAVQPALARLAMADFELADVEKLDPKWAEPVIRRGFLAHRRVLIIGNTDPAEIPRWLSIAQQNADRALSLAPRNPDALELQGTVAIFRWLYHLAPDSTGLANLLTTAEAAFRASVTVNPLQASAWNGLSYVLWEKDDNAEARLAAQQAYASDPYLKDIDRTIWRLFQTSFALHDTAAAAKWCAVGRQRIPKNYRFAECRLTLYTAPGQHPNVDSIWAANRAFVALVPASIREFSVHRGGMLVAAALVQAGLADSARAVAVRSRGDTHIDPAAELLEAEARIRASLGDTDEAIRLLAAYLAINPQRRLALTSDSSSQWATLRTDPRFRALVGERR